VTLGFDWIVELLPVVLPVLIDSTGDADRLVGGGSSGILVPRDMIDNSSYKASREDRRRLDLKKPSSRNISLLIPLSSWNLRLL
jgi:hypothetical protein